MDVLWAVSDWDMDDQIQLSDRRRRRTSGRLVSRKRSLLLVVAIAAVTVAAIARGASDGPAVGSPATFAPARAPVAPFRGSLAGGVAELATRLPWVENVRIGEVRLTGIEGKLLEYDLRVRGFGGGQIAEAVWQGNLLAGAVADKLAAEGLRLGDVQATLINGDGDRQPIGGGVGNVVRDQRFTAIPADIRERAVDNGRALGLKAVQVSVLRVLQDAVAVRAQTATPRVTAGEMLGRQNDFVKSLLGVEPHAFEGVFIAVEDTSGALVAVSGYAARAGSSLVWVDPGLNVETGRAFFPTSERDS